MASWDTNMLEVQNVSGTTHTLEEIQAKGQSVFLALRLITLVLLMALIMYHIKSLRVFRWEHSVSGGVLVTYAVAVAGLALTAGLNHGSGIAFQAYICATGTLLLLINAVVIYRRWRRAGNLTRVVAELLGAIGMPLRRQVLIKVVLSAAVATVLFVDLSLAIILMLK